MSRAVDEMIEKAVKKAVEEAAEKAWYETECICIINIMDSFHVGIEEAMTVLKVEEKDRAMLRLGCELHAGIRSADEEGWISEEEIRKHLSERKSNLQSMVHTE